MLTNPTQATRDDNNNDCDGSTNAVLGILYGNVLLGRSCDLPWGNVALCAVDLLGSTMLHRDRWAESRAKTARHRG